MITVARILCLLSTAFCGSLFGAALAQPQFPIAGLAFLTCGVAGCLVMGAIVAMEPRE